MWVSGGMKTDPVADDILADSGALAVGVTAAILVSSTVGLTVELVRRNAANNADVHVHPILVSAYVPFIASGIPIGLSINERVLLRVKDGATGDVQGSILS